MRSGTRHNARVLFGTPPLTTSPPFSGAVATPRRHCATGILFEKFEEILLSRAIDGSKDMKCVEPHTLPGVPHHLSREKTHAHAMWLCFQVVSQARLWQRHLPLGARRQGAFPSARPPARPGGLVVPRPILRRCR